MGFIQIIIASAIAALSATSGTMAREMGERTLTQGELSHPQHPLSL
jgi:hypothetical protein